MTARMPLAAVIAGALTVQCAVLCALPSLGAAPTEAPTRGAIDRVVVFADRAEVTRVQTARCAGGNASVTFAELPDAVDPRTLRGDADGGAVAVGVATTTVQLAEALDARVATLQAELRRLDDRLAALERGDHDSRTRAHTWGSYASYLRDLVTEEMRQSKPDTARWEQVLKALEGEADQGNTAVVARAAERRVLQRQRERFAARLARLDPSAAPAHLNATVAVTCGGATAPKVRLSYVVPGATWRPEYDLRFTRAAEGAGKVGDGTAVITVAGVVSQATGEDWVDAQIALSTAKPALGGEAPLPNRITVAGHPEEKGKTLVQAQEDRPEDLGAGRAGGAAPAAGAALDDGGKAFVLTLPRRVTLRADGRPSWFPVDDLRTKAASVLVAVPARAPYVYQVAKLANPAAFPLMAGAVQVYRGGTFVGVVDLEYRAPGEPFEVSLGIDEEIELDRKDLLLQRREAGLLSGNQTVAHSYRTILKNRSAVDVTVEVREQIPVSKTADITVAVDQKETSAGYRLDAHRGHLTWAVPLKKGATGQRDISFAIQLPKEWSLR
ncbi:MAG: mucoidy inhibitor MuiA family protein [Deltaproteobacteria bacterium]|nr:mucoidy inhibitor MuiA family protein [Deltaproteobacteria bacterium]